MSAMLGTLFRTAILDDAAYQEWRERPNLFLRGIVLILIITLIAGLITFAVNLVNTVQPVDALQIISNAMSGTTAITVVNISDIRQLALGLHFNPPPRVP